jgi:MFS transporter, DHA1 family, multidrug resistance protein
MRNSLTLRPDTLSLTVVLALMTALDPLSTDMYLASLPTIRVAMQASVATTQLTLSVFLAGFACGQLVHGPVSDRLGRRPVLLAGFVLFVAASVWCALAGSIESLITARFVQAFGAAAPSVLARAIVRDLYHGPRAGRELSRMGTVMGLVPALAPVLGAALQSSFGWQANFVVCAGFGIVLAMVSAAMLPETARIAAAGRFSPAALLGSYRRVLSSRAYLAYVGMSATTFCGLFAFISGSSIVLQGTYGLGPVAFALCFSVMVLGYMAGTMLAARVIGRLGIDGTIGVGVRCLLSGGLAMLVLVLAGLGGAAGLVAPMAVFAAGVGLVLPQAVAGAMTPFPDMAGAASSLFGIIQTTTAALSSALLGALLSLSPLPLPAMIAASGALAFALFLSTRAVRTVAAPAPV